MNFDTLYKDTVKNSFKSITTVTQEIIISINMDILSKSKHGLFRVEYYDFKTEFMDFLGIFNYEIIQGGIKVERENEEKVNQVFRNVINYYKEKGLNVHSSKFSFIIDWNKGE